LRGEFDAALTHLEWLDRYPDQLKLDRLIGEVDTTWVVYGTTKRFAGEVIGIPSPELYAGQKEETKIVTGVVGSRK